MSATLPGFDAWHLLLVVGESVTTVTEYLPTRATRKQITDTLAKPVRALQRDHEDVTVTVRVVPPRGKPFTSTFTILSHARVLRQERYQMDLLLAKLTALMGIDQ